MKLAPQTKDCLNRYSPTVPNLGTRIEEDLAKLHEAPRILPVVGMQGMGKSTLLDALLGKQLLPAEADETTCVPVEIKYGPQERAIVHLPGSRQVIEPVTSGALAEFVDNALNAGNAKKVEFIELFCPAEIVRDGLVLVDLPGVGSLTQVNEETTRRYLRDIVAAIFVISLVPPIRKQDATFIKMFWAQFRAAVFVQNDWGETDEELAQGSEHNTAILKKIGAELNCPLSPAQILTVNAHQALSGALTHDQKEVAASRIEALRQAIRDLAADWEARLEEAFRARLRLSLTSALAEARRRLGQIHASEEERKKAADRELAEFKAVSRKLKDKVMSLQIQLGTKIHDLGKKVEEQAQKTKENICSQIFAVIDQGTVDGPYLAEAFKNIQTVELETFGNFMVDELNRLGNELREELEGLNELLLQERFRMQAPYMSVEEKLKFEKVVGAAIGVGGVVGAFLGAGALAGFIVSNPAGWVVGAVGVAITVVASLLGFSVTSLCHNMRKSGAKKKLEPKIKELENTLVAKCKQDLESVRREIHANLDALVAERKSAEGALAATLQTPVNTDDAERLEADIRYLSEAQNHV